MSNEKYENPDWELEADGVPTSSGIRGWTYQVVRNILTNENILAMPFCKRPTPPTASARR